MFCMLKGVWNIGRKKNIRGKFCLPYNIVLYKNLGRPVVSHAKLLSRYLLVAY